MEPKRVKRVYKRKNKEVEKMEDIPELLEPESEVVDSRNTNTITINYPMPAEAYKLVLNIEFPELKQKIIELLNIK